MSTQAAIDYLRRPPGAPWRWEENGRVLVWSDGTTLLFREELAILVERLAPTGLPPFEALVVLLAASRGKSPVTVSPMDAVEAGPGRGQLLLKLQSRHHDQVTKELEGLAELPAELLARASGKAFLAEAVFEAAPRLRPAESMEIRRGLAEVGGDDLLNTPAPEAPPVNLARALHVVAAGAARHTRESLLRRLSTGLDALPRAAPDLELELPREERMRRLLEALGTDDQHAGLACVVRELMAALRLPRSLTAADETAAEGVSDIGNRGPLDRLVLSELAHDDLTLAARVALNEALYLRREPPAQRPERALAVLLDSGLRMWGVPRVLGLAAALVLVSRHPSGCDALAWRAEGRTAVPTDLLTKEGLEKHLAALGTELHPGAALPALAKALAEHGEVDAVIVTHRDALADAAFQAQLARLECDRGFVLVVARDGLVQLFPLPWGAPRPLAEAQIDVNHLFARPEKPRVPALIDPALGGDWPAIFREPLFPLLLPINAKIELAASAGESGGLCVTADRRLLHWEKRGLGARQLATDLPAGQTSWLHFDPKADRVVMVKGRGGDGRMSVMLVATDGGEPKLARFTGPHHPLAVWIDRHVLLVALHTRVVAWSLATGEVLTETPIPPGLQWVSGAYYVDDAGLQFAAWNGSAVAWDSLPAGRGLRRTEILTVFDRDGIGPWILRRDGRLLSPTGSEHMNTSFPVDDVRIPVGGALVMVRAARTEQWHRMDLTHKGVDSVPNFTPSAPQGKGLPPSLVPPTRNLQHNFTSVWAAPGQPLRLRKAKMKSGAWLDVFHNSGGALQLVDTIDTTDGTLQTDAREFSAVSCPYRLGCTLKVARWPGGSVAWLDSRGLLHLRSSNPKVPELTLALSHQAALAGWSSSGVCCGPEFFLGEKTTGDVKAVHDILKAFCQHAC